MSFFIWYYTRGVAMLIQNGGNVLHYAFYRSNVFLLAKTLISPWRRDVSHRTWRGLHPLLALQAFFNNLISRFLGMLVRLGVILYGLLWELVVGVLFVILVGAYCFAPMGIFLAFPFFALSWTGGAVAFVIFFCILLFAFLAWQNDRNALRADKAAVPAPWRKRTFQRLGLDDPEFMKQNFSTHEEMSAAIAERHVKETDFAKSEAWEKAVWERRSKRSKMFSWENLKKSAPIGKFWAYGYTPHLDRYLTDLSESDFSDYGRFEWIGRQEVYELVQLTLSRPMQNSVILIGNPGVGKKTLIHTLARDIRENVFSDSALNFSRVVLFDLGEVMAEARSNHLDPKSLIRELFAEVAVAGNIILVIENIDLYLLPDEENNISDVLNEFLGLSTFRVIGTMTPATHQKLTEEQIPALKFFESIPVPEPKPEEVERILIDYFAPYERKNVLFTLKGIEAILRASQNENWDTPFPERAIDLAQEVLLFWEKNAKRSAIDEQIVADFLTLKSGMPQGEVGEAEREKLLNLEEELHERVVGQVEAVRQVAESFRKARTGLGNKKRPLGSFLFLGPTGVGKTETAKALAAVYFGEEEKMVRLDMSEFQSQESINDLIGSSETKTPGRMTELVKAHPYSILLLDEIDKAHPRVLDVFLQILDEGFVTDDFGNKVNFRNLIIIATSNAGATLIHQAAESGKSVQALKEELIESIIRDNSFRPEFLNRFDGIILFNALTREEIETVTRMKLQSFAKKVMDEKGISLEFGDDVVPELVARGYEPEFGVRSINRYIADVVEDRVVQKILADSLSEGAVISLRAQDVL